MFPLNKGGSCPGNTYNDHYSLGNVLAYGSELLHRKDNRKSRLELYFLSTGVLSLHSLCLARVQPAVRLSLLYHHYNISYIAVIKKGKHVYSIPCSDGPCYDSTLWC